MPLPDEDLNPFDCARFSKNHLPEIKAPSAPFPEWYCIWTNTLSSPIGSCFPLQEHTHESNEMAMQSLCFANEESNIDCVPLFQMTHWRERVSASLSLNRHIEESLMLLTSHLEDIHVRKTQKFRDQKQLIDLSYLEGWAALEADFQKSWTGNCWVDQITKDMLMYLRLNVTIQTC